MNEETKDTRMLPVQCNCAWNPDRHADSCPVNLRDRLTDAQRLLSQLREELAQRDAEIERLRDALGDIAVKAQQSRTETRRLTWIAGRAESALAGKPWAKQVFMMPDPKNGQPKAERLTAENAELKGRLAALSPAGGGVVPDLATLKFALSELHKCGIKPGSLPHMVLTNLIDDAKPQANSQEADK